MNLSHFSNPQKFEVKSIADLQSFIKSEAQHWPKRTIILLSGPMGAGKTEFVKQWRLLNGNSTSPRVTSPTYAIHQNYLGADHFDLYRLNDESELESTGFWDLFAAKEGLIFIEWPEKLNLDQLPRSWSCFCYQLSVDAGSRIILKLSRDGR
jgi:tRNA threonylcarbamoyladenosine biosynthesis protein TsaE